MLPGLVSACMLLAVMCRIGMSAAKIIAKIENMEGLVNYKEIMEQCDVMLFSRGSMGNCVDPEKMFLAQKMLLRVRAGWRILLHSLVCNPPVQRLSHAALNCEGHGSCSGSAAGAQNRNGRYQTVCAVEPCFC